MACMLSVLTVSCGSSDKDGPGLPRGFESVQADATRLQPIAIAHVIELSRCGDLALRWTSDVPSSKALDALATRPDGSETMDAWIDAQAADVQKAIVDSQKRLTQPYAPRLLVAPAVDDTRPERARVGNAELGVAVVWMQMPCRAATLGLDKLGPADVPRFDRSESGLTDLSDLLDALPRPIIVELHGIAEAVARQPQIFATVECTGDIVRAQVDGCRP